MVFIKKYNIMKKTLIFLLVIYLVLCGLHTKAQNCIKADLMILIDWSGSERGHELELATAASLFVSELPVSEDQLRIGLITFSDGIDDIVPLTGDKEILMDDIASTATIEASGLTYMQQALNLAGGYLINQRNVPKIIIIISDGEIYDIEKSSLEMTMIKSMMLVNVFAVQIGKHGKEEQFEKLVLLTGNPHNVEIALPLEILKALKKLNICG